MSATPTIRAASESDLAAINDIYNYYAATSATTYDDQPWPLQRRQAWFANRLRIHPVWIIDLAGEVIAWASLGPFRPHVGYRYTVENSIYVAPGHLRKGLGRLLLTTQIDFARAADVHLIVACIDSEQVGSIELHRKFGFVEVGRLPEAGRKADRWLTPLFMSLIVDD